MIIGIYLGDMHETEGGGFTFQEAVAHEMLQMSTPHQFIFIYSGFDIFDKQDLSHHKKVRLPFNLLISSSVFGRLHGIRKRIIRSMKKIYPGQNTMTFFDWWIKKYSIQLLWVPGYKNIDTDIPYIYTIWDLQHRLQPFFPEVSANRQWQHREAMLTQMTQKATYVITGTIAGKKELQQFYGIPDDRIKLLLHPTPQFAIQYQEKKIPLTLPVPEDFIFYPAQFWPHKNHITFLKALKSLKEKQNRIVNTVFVGHDYGNKKYIREKAKEFGIEQQIFLFDFLRREELIALYQHAKALVYISHFGPENLPPLEAMALGCPVVYGKVNGAEEQLGASALLVNQLSAEDVADGIARILDDKNLREELIQRGYRRAQSYTTEHYVKDLMSIIDEFELLRQCWP